MDDKYTNCISLGWYCGVAFSLSRLGLRSQSGPFDWYRSHYWAVLYQIEHDFRDFMAKEHLEIQDKAIREFRDIKYDFYFLHDVKEDFETEYQEIYEKYQQRIAGFRQAIKEPTVFFRCVRDSEEVAYINEHWAYAEKVVKKYNKRNRIVYLLRRGLGVLTDNVCWYELKISEYIGKTYEMRHLFDTCDEVLAYCATILDTPQMKKNIEFDINMNKNTENVGYVLKCIEEEIDDVCDQIMCGLDISKGDGIYVWGAGRYGIALASYLSARSIRIISIIDSFKTESPDDSYSICSFDDVMDGAKIFIAVSNEKANNSIYKKILREHRRTRVLRYLDLEDKNLDIISHVTR